MTTADARNLIADNYMMPELRTYTPSEWDVRWAITPRRIKKMNEMVEKENAKLRAAYDTEIAIRESTVNSVNALDKYPAELKSLFFHTIEWTLSDIQRRHDARVAAETEFKNKYGDDVYDHVYVLSSLCFTRSYRSKVTDAVVTDDAWSKFVKYNGYGSTKCVTEIADWKTLIEDYRNLTSIRNGDESYNCSKHCSKGKLAYVKMIALRRVTATLVRIADEINTHFEGGIPSTCETSPNWGVGGHFNGILSDGNTRVSFKSFCAGGWNIVRFHYRFKITKLKSKKESTK